MSPLLFALRKEVWAKFRVAENRTGLWSRASSCFRRFPCSVCSLWAQTQAQPFLLVRHRLPKSEVFLPRIHSCVEQACMAIPPCVECGAPGRLCFKGSGNLRGAVIIAFNNSRHLLNTYYVPSTILNTLNALTDLALTECLSISKRGKLRPREEE